MLLRLTCSVLLPPMPGPQRDGATRGQKLAHPAAACAPMSSRTRGWSGGMLGGGPWGGPACPPSLAASRQPLMLTLPPYSGSCA